MGPERKAGKGKEKVLTSLWLLRRKKRNRMGLSNRAGKKLSEKEKEEASKNRFGRKHNLRRKKTQKKNYVKKKKRTRGATEGSGESCDRGKKN